MVLLAALLLRADDLGAKVPPHTPGSESDFSRVVIALFIVGLVIAGGIAVRMIMRGLAHRIQEKEK